MWPLVTYSNCFEIVSTVAGLSVVLTWLILGMFACNTVPLYTIKLMMIIQGIIKLRYNIRSAWFLDIRISTC